MGDHSISKESFKLELRRKWESYALSGHIFGRISSFTFHESGRLIGEKYTPYLTSYSIFKHFSSSNKLSISE